MQTKCNVRYVVAVLHRLFTGVFAATVLIYLAVSQANAVEGGEAGFVVHEWGVAKSRGPAACPNGRSLGYRKIFEQSPQGQRRQGETDAQYSSRAEAGQMALAVVDGQNLCANPELMPDPDPHYRTMDATSVLSYGIDLDGQVSTRQGSPAPGTCVHDDFSGLNGVSGIDNQYLRLTGCTGNPPTETIEDDSGWLPPPADALENTMLEGGWGILIALKGVDDLKNDDDVVVGIYANADPIVLNTNRDPVPYATYAADQDQRFRGETTGRIVDGVLSTDPVNVRFHWLVAGMHLERPIDHARIQARFNEDGNLEGYLVGYTPVEDLYDFQYGFRNAKDDARELVPAGRTSAIATGAASVMGRTCNGVYAALYQLADGDLDPETRRCTSISTQYFFRATPAFVVDVESRGQNESLIEE